MATPPEPLHAVLLGIMVRLFQFFDANLTEKYWKILLDEIPSIVSSIGQQSCVSEYPDCRKFKTGNLGQGHLSGKQKYTRIVLIYIALSRTSVFKSFEHTNGKTPKLSKGQISKKKNGEVIPENSVKQTDSRRIVEDEPVPGHGNNDSAESSDDSVEKDCEREANEKDRRTWKIFLSCPVSEVLILMMIRYTVIL